MPTLAETSLKDLSQHCWHGGFFAANLIRSKAPLRGFANSIAISAIVRRTLGHKLQRHRVLLGNSVSFLEAQGAASISR
jgi:hypothetical protein